MRHAPTAKIAKTVVAATTAEPATTKKPASANATKLTPVKHANAAKPVPANLARASLKYGVFAWQPIEKCRVSPRQATYFSCRKKSKQKSSAKAPALGEVLLSFTTGSHDRCAKCLPTLPGEL